MAIDFTDNTDLVKGAHVVIWDVLGASKTGATYECTKQSDKTIDLSGTFGGTVTVQGCMDGSSWKTLKDHIGNDLAVTDATVALIAEHTRFIRVISGSGVSAVVATLFTTDGA